VCGVDGDLFYRRGALYGGSFFLAREVGGGYLQAVEQEAGAFGVDVVRGEAAEDLADGELDGGSVFRLEEREAGLTAATLAEVFHRAAAGVVKIAKFFVFK